MQIDNLLRERGESCFPHREMKSRVEYEWVVVASFLNVVKVTIFYDLMLIDTCQPHKREMKFQLV